MVLRNYDFLNGKNWLTVLAIPKPIFSDGLLGLQFRNLFFVGLGPKRFNANIKAKRTKIICLKFHPAFKPKCTHPMCWPKLFKIWCFCLKFIFSFDGWWWASQVVFQAFAQAWGLRGTKQSERMFMFSLNPHTDSCLESGFYAEISFFFGRVVVGFSTGLLGCQFGNLVLTTCHQEAMMS